MWELLYTMPAKNDHPPIVDDGSRQWPWHVMQAVVFGGVVLYWIWRGDINACGGASIAFMGLVAGVFATLIVGWLLRLFFFLRSCLSNDVPDLQEGRRRLVRRSSLPEPSEQRTSTRVSGKPRQLLD